MKDKKRGIIEKEGDRFTGFQPLFSWDLHEKSWTENTLYPTLIIKYEDLVMDTTSTFTKVLKFIKSVTKTKNNIDEQKLLTCVENCKFSNLYFPCPFSFSLRIVTVSYTHLRAHET